MFLHHINSIARPLLRLHPQGEAFARHILFHMWRFKVRLISHSKKLDANKTFWVNPHIIQYALSEPHFNKYGDMGKILAGTWDLNTTKFTDTDVHKAFYAHFIHTQPWESTGFYHRVLQEIRSGTTKWGCHNPAEFCARLEGLDSLYKDIKENGYKAQHELFETQQPGLPSLESIDEIAVRIGREGDLLLQDGRHRLAIAQLLDVPQVPIKITARHSEWYQFRKEILTYAKRNGNRVYQPLTHIDLSDIPFRHSESRFEIIKPYIPERRGNLLDLGAHWGYFCHKYEDEGFNCYAIENDIGSLYFLKKLKRAENKGFQIIEESILNFRTKTNFTVVLALNIFHHFLKERDTYYDLIEFLKTLNMEIMLFETHLPTENQMMGAYKNYECEEFADFILQHSSLNHYKFIGKSEDERPIYIMYR